MTLAFLIGAIVSLGLATVGTPTFFGILRLLGIYTTLKECQAKVYVLFGKVIGVLTEPGLQWPLLRLGPQVLLVPWFGKVHQVDLRLDQRYLRSQPVNTEEGTPMGIGVWYEMRVSRPVEFLFENADPVGSLQANVKNATVRSLSNMPLPGMLENRHEMSRRVREEVSPTSEGWGYQLGSVYIRKVHFRDLNMIHQIEQKVVNRLRQVTSAIRQAGANQVDIITSAAEKEAAVEFARASAVRPELVGRALADISRDPEVLGVLFETLEAEKLLESSAELTLIVGGQDAGMLKPLLASQPAPPAAGS